MRVVLLGAGLQGIATALDLAWSKDVTEVLLGDIDLNRAQYVADICNKKYGNKVKAVRCDVSDFDALVEMIKGYDVLINDVNYYFNRHIMEACLKAHIHYIDIGGLYVETKKQMEYDQKFKDAGLIAIIGIGGTPGVTNVCARWAADRLDTIDEINFYCGCDDWGQTSKAFAVTYAIDTIMDEFEMEPIQYLNNEYVKLPAHSGTMDVEYSQPIGKQNSYYIMHSEIATIPEVFKDKGLKNCTFRIGFSESTFNTLKFLSDLGLGRKDEIDAYGTKVSPIKVLKKLMELQPEDPNDTINDCDIILTEVIGRENGKKVVYKLEAVCRPVKEWPELLGAQVYIGGAPSWAAQMLFKGQITGTGVFPPEVCIPPEEFFEEAAKREIYITATKIELLGTDDWEAVMRKKKINQWED